MPSRAGAISGIGVSVSPSQRNTLTRPTSNDVAGIISTITHSPDQELRVDRRGSRAIANPAQDATSTESGTATTVTNREFAVYRASGTTSNIRA